MNEYVRQNSWPVLFICVIYLFNSFYNTVVILTSKTIILLTCLYVELISISQSSSILSVCLHFMEQAKRIIFLHIMLVSAGFLPVHIERDNALYRSALWAGRWVKDFYSFICGYRIWFGLLNHVGVCGMGRVWIECSCFHSSNLTLCERKNHLLITSKRKCNSVKTVHKACLTFLLGDVGLKGTAKCVFFSSVTFESGSGLLSLKGLLSKHSLGWRFKRNGPPFIWDLWAAISRWKRLLKRKTLLKQDYPAFYVQWKSVLIHYFLLF